MKLKNNKFKTVFEIADMYDNKTLLNLLIKYENNKI
jgi:hypothetical protein